jgi:hypothetical protein
VIVNELGIVGDIDVDLPEFDLPEFDADLEPIAS